MAKVNLQGLIDEVLNMAKERQAMETGSDRGTNAWNAREVDKINSRNRKNWDEEDSQKRLGKQAMDLQGLKNTGAVDVENIGQAGAKARTALTTASQENIASQDQMTKLMQMRSTSGDAVLSNASQERRAQITGDSLVKANQVKADVLGEPGKGPVAPGTGQTLTETKDPIAPVTPAPGTTLNAAGVNEGQVASDKQAADAVKLPTYEDRFNAGKSALGINIGMQSPKARNESLAYDRSSREQLAKANTPEAMAADEERKKRNRERLGRKD